MSSTIENANWAVLGEEIETILKGLGVPGCAVGVVFKGDLIYSAGFGTRNETGDPVTPDTLFQIASTTKAFTAFAFGTLVDAGKVDWETPVTSIYPKVEFQDPFTQKYANFIDLMSHRTGLSSCDVLMSIWPSVEEINSRIKFLKPTKQFRQEWMYNNHMWNLVGSVAASLHGSSLEDLITQSVLTPLEMTNTFANVNKMLESSNWSRGYMMKNCAPSRVVEFEEHALADVDEGDGCMISCVNDLAKWVALMNRKGKTPSGKELLSKEQFEKLITPHMVAKPSPVSDKPTQFDSYGLGWFLSTYRGKVLVDHSGGCQGYITEIYTFPNDDLGIIVLTNAMSSAARVIAKTLADRLLFPTLFIHTPPTWFNDAMATLKKDQEKKETDRAERIAKRDLTKVPSLPLQEYQGTYRNDAYGTLLIDELNEKGFFKFWIHGSGGKQGLVTGVLGHWESDSFGIFETKCPWIDDHEDYECPLEDLMFDFQDGGAEQVLVLLDEEDHPVLFQRVHSD
ncbi:beta-lactamase/transpeptidase-like protein [Obelidium mucronatum]|nr:beta-lactamase/transpeptidase-like protein [Obelidium mucronatum]